MDIEQLIARAAADLLQLNEQDGGRRPVTIELTLAEAYMVLSHLQLALSHPANAGESARIVRNIAGEIQARIEARATPALKRMIEIGWKREFDLPAGLRSAPAGGCGHA